MNEQEKDSIKQNTEYVSSPLRHDYEGRFSRKGKVKDKSLFGKGLADNILVALFIFLLFACDFILFTGSGNVKIFNNDWFPIPEVLAVLGVIAVISGVAVFIFYKHPKVRHLMASLTAFLFVFMVYNQFALYLPDFNFGTYIVPKYIVFGIISAIITYLIFESRTFIYRVLYVIALMVLCANVLLSYKSTVETHEFLETHNTQKSVEEPAKRFIYFIFPNLVSYSYLSTVHNSEAAKTQQIMRGFLQKNNFRVYAKAYTPEKGYLDNMILSMNPTSSKQSWEHLNKTRVLSEYWRFYNLRNEYIYLKDNELYDIFARNKYQLSAYKSRDFDLCRKKNKYNVNRCIEKINHPIDIYSVNMNIAEKSGILIVEWISSLKIFEKISSGIYKLLSKVTNVDNVPMIGTNYKNLYVVNSIKTFDILADNIKSDTGRQAYFVFIDLPSDMYIYDEYCKVSSQRNWFSISNLPWINSDYTADRQEAYLKQTRCLFGKLEEFIDDLKKDALWNDTIMIIQGVSGVNGFQNKNIKDVSEEFLTNRTVSMAVYDSRMSKMEVDKRFCSTTQILAEYLLGRKNCTNSIPGVHQKVVDSLNNNLDKLSENVKYNSIADFENWYQQWLAANTSGNDENYEDLIKTEDKTENSESEENKEEEVTDTTDETEIPQEIGDELLAEKEQGGDISEDDDKEKEKPQKEDNKDELDEIEEMLGQDFEETDLENKPAE